jgi:hypothetical protein
MEVTLMQNLTWPNIRKDLEAAFNSCHELAWNRVDVYLIEPLTIKTTSGKK